MNRFISMGHADRLVSYRMVVSESSGRAQLLFNPKLISLALALLSPAVLAGPVGGNISAGTGAIAQAGTTTTITQQSQNLAIDWLSFSIGSSEAVHFEQPNASAIALNRVLGQDSSSILGSLTANGQVFILNPNGVLFGSTAQVSVGGLVASTLNINNTDFMAGNYIFSNGGAAGSVVNQGSLNAASKGYIALLASEVRNEGVITATLGTALLAAGDKVTLNLNNGSMLSYSIDQGSFNALAENKQLIRADGGQVIMSAKAADALSTAVVNNTGIIEARTIQNVGGVIKLMGDMQVGQINVGGTLDASAQNGGNGGFIETSAAHVHVADTAQITTAATSGHTGIWLIDPNDYTIAATGGDITGAALATNLATTNVTISSADGATSGNGDIFVNDTVTWNSVNSLTLNAIHNIQVNQAITNSGSGSVNLRADSAAACVAGAASCGTVSFTGPGHITAATTNLYYNPAGSNNTAGANGIGPSYATPTNYTANVTGTLNAYMLVNDVNQLQAITTNLAGKYALGTNIDATATSGWNSGAGFEPFAMASGSFTGTFDGLGHTISNLVINRPTTNYVGLFGYTGAGSVIRNVGLVGGSISGLNCVGGLVGCSGGGTINNNYTTSSVSGINYVGGLVGGSSSSITNSYATGSVSGGTNGRVGGLVGQNNATISASYASGTVTGGTGGFAGGLVGYNNYAGNVTTDYATGSVIGGTNGYVGGLVGQNNGLVNKSFSSGNVSGALSFRVGGLVGINYSIVSNSFWDTQTSGQATSQGGVGMTTADMMTQANFTSATAANGNVNPGWDFTNTWFMVDGATRPFLRSEYSTTINNAHQLQLMVMDLGASYILGSDIDLAELSNASGMWNTTSGFVPIGDSTTPFTGQLDGSSYNISSLYIYLPSTNYVGLFGYTSAATLSNVNVAGSVTGYDYVGGIVGKTNNLSTVSTSSFTGSVTGNTNVGGIVGGNDPSSINNVLVNGNVSGVSNVGGVAGWNDASVINGATFYGTVSGTDGVGGLTGENSGTSYVSNIIVGGGVSGTSNVGGLVGLNNNTGAVSGSYWDTQASGQANAVGSGTSTGTTGLTNAQMTQQSSFTDLDFINTWRIYEGHTAPLLTSFLTPLTITVNDASKTYDGLAYSGGNGYTTSSTVDANLLGSLTYMGSSQGAINAGSYAISVGGFYSNQHGYNITIVDGALTVNTAPLTITANNANKTYDGLVYSGGNGVTYTGLVNGETSSVLGGTLAYGGVSQGATNAGSYAITPGGLTAGNYTISYVDGALTVNATPLTVTANNASKTYDGLAYSSGNGVTYSGLVNGETSSVLSGTLAYGGSSQGAINAGSYAITPGGLTSGNYTISYADGTLTVLGTPAQVANAFVGPALPSAYESAVVTADFTIVPIVIASNTASSPTHTTSPKEVDPSSHDAASGDWARPIGGLITLVDGGVKLPEDRIGQEKRGM